MGENINYPGAPKEWNDLVDKVESSSASVQPFYASPEEQSEYLARVYKDCLPKDNFDAVYGFGCHRHNECSVLEKVWVCGHNWSKFVLVLGRGEYVLKDGAVAYSGEIAWRNGLVSPEGLAPIDHKILSVPAVQSGGENYNTFLESLDVMGFVKSQGWGSLVIVAFPAHLPRAFASIVTVAKHLGWNGKIFAACGKSLPWLEGVTHSHGTGAITRATSVKEEQKRLDTYCKSGKPVPLLRAGGLLKYLNERDA